jgi:hypothetical protein
MSTFCGVIFSLNYRPLHRPKLNWFTSIDDALPKMSCLVHYDTRYVRSDVIHKTIRVYRRKHLNGVDRNRILINTRHRTAEYNSKMRGKIGEQAIVNSIIIDLQRSSPMHVQRQTSISRCTLVNCQVLKNSTVRP